MNAACTARSVASDRQVRQRMVCVTIEIGEARLGRSASEAWMLAPACSSRRSPRDACAPTVVRNEAITAQKAMRSLPQDTFMVGSGNCVNHSPQRFAAQGSSALRRRHQVYDRPAPSAPHRLRKHRNMVGNARSRRHRHRAPPRQPAERGRTWAKPRCKAPTSPAGPEKLARKVARSAESQSDGRV